MASSLMERSTRLEKASERLASDFIHWQPLRHWAACGVLLLLLVRLEQLHWRHDAAVLFCAVLESFQQSFGAWVCFAFAAVLENAFRVVVACVALIGTIEVAWSFSNSSNSRHQSHLALPAYSLRNKPLLAGCVFVGIGSCWYLAICPPNALSVVYTVWRSCCILCAGLFLCASIFETDGWKYVPLSALCLFLSGSRSCKLLFILDGLSAASHSFQYFQRLYFLHEAKRDFHDRVRCVLEGDSLHLAFVEESFEKIVMRSLGSPMARRLSFGLQRCLSLGTQSQMLRQRYDALMRSVHAHHKDVSPLREHVLEIQRDQLLSCSLHAVQEVTVDQILAETLRIKYSGELGEDEGGLLRDWFDSIGGCLTSEAALQQTCETQKLPLLALHKEDGTLVLRAGTERWDDFYALGRLLALAVYRGGSLPVHLSRGTWKVLLGDAIDANDIFAIDAQFFAHRVGSVLRPGGVEEMSELMGEPLRFMSAGTDECPELVELMPGGRERLVTEENKLEYVEKLCEFYLCGHVRREWQLLRRGFDDILPRHLLTCNKINDKDLELLVAGMPSIDVDDWRANSIVDGPLAGSKEGDELLGWFWDIVDQFGDERRARLLQFVTGSSRLPVNSFRGLEPCFCIYLSDAPPDRLPTASTCVNQLSLTPCESRRALIEKLKKICHVASEGFGLV
eukprot:TRINITY_DN13506_c0_g1_i1.p1 TRINITY_DN13506_c0_g1~~TRINITY_DN13506_c0_g1_i1.p1  ORF type:complete len:712 (-),score=85.91 TRINITY_DN13506_c0_g1_i1:56-2092(-)